MYWIRVEFENGKVLTKDGMTLNESYNAVSRYCRARQRVKVKSIVTGRGNNEARYMCT